MATAEEVKLESKQEYRMRSRIDKKSADLTEQWAKRVISYSSQYNATTWSADCVLGTPRVYPRYGDIHGAWAQGQNDSNQFIEVEYNEAVYMSEVHIYETLNAGAVTRVAASNESGDWVTLWEADDGPQLIQTSRIFQPTITEPEFQSKQLRLELDCSLAGSWCEIDAIKVKGRIILLDAAPPLTTLSDQLYTLVNNKEFADCRFLVAGEEVYGHKAILSARSDYFRAMFSEGMLEARDSKPIPMPDISLIAFMGVMQFIYTNQIDTSVTPLHLVEIIRVADRFSLAPLQRLGHHYLVEEISVENVIEIFREATEKLPVLDGLRKTCLNLISRNMDKVSRTPGFCSLPQEIMLEIIQEATTQLSIK